MVLKLKFKNEKKATVVPTEKKGAENVVTKKKFNFKEMFKNIFGSIKKGFGSLVILVKNHKGISIATLVVLIAAIAGLVFIPSHSSPEKTMKKHLNDIGVKFYEDFYFKSAGNGDTEKRKEFLAKYEQIGIKVSLDNLVRYYVTTDSYKELENAKNDATVTERVEALEKEWFQDKKYNCDKDNTKVIIYPQAPFEQASDYKLELVTVCGFKDDDKSVTTTTQKKKDDNTVTNTKNAEATTQNTTKKTTKKK